MAWHATGGLACHWWLSGEGVAGAGAGGGANPAGVGFRLTGGGFVQALRRVLMPS